MVFELEGKVALVTGGASGIGLRYAKELLRNGAQGVTVADIDPQSGQTALKEIEKEFGPNRAIFVKTDVTDKQQFEGVFKKTIEAFKYVDILFNNAGILNDILWEKQIAINVNGVVNGMILGVDKYLQKYSQGSEALIVNISSIAGVSPFASFPVYSGTKLAVIGFTRAWADHYESTKVRVIAICPGITETPLLSKGSENLGERYNIMRNQTIHLPRQMPEYIASEVVKLLKRSENGTLWVIEGGQPAYQYILPERRIQ